MQKDKINTPVSLLSSKKNSFGDVTAGQRERRFRWMRGLSYVQNFVSLER